MSKSEFTSKALSEVSAAKLTEKFVLLKKELFNLRFQKKLGELTNTSRFAQVRKDIARVETELSKRRKANA
jgi:large subunit ribosomal protein L29